MAPPKGWEIEPGPAFWDEQLFQPYLEAFMTLHDGRRAEDEAAYAMLLTDYIGVTADGQLRNGSSEERCLREVMLGYLKTYEVVEGGNCLSCSRCVPNERFDATIEQRKRTVVKLGRVVEELLEQIELQTTTAPSVTLLAELAAVIAEEQRAGRGLTGYLVGWTNRLLADTPNHRGAVWTRLQLMASELVPFDAMEFGQWLLVLAELQPGRDDAERLLRFVDAAPDDARGRATLRRADAALYRVVGDVDREIQALIAARSLAAVTRDRAWLPTVLGRLRALSGPEGQAPDSARWEDVTLELAELTHDSNEAYELYRSVLASWDGPRLQQYLTDLRDRAVVSAITMAVRAWLSIVVGPPDARRLQDAAAILELVDPSMLERLADADLALVWPFLSEQRQPGLAIRAARQVVERRGADVNDTRAAIDAVTLAASAGVTVPSDLRQLIAEHVLRELPTPAQDTHGANQLMHTPVGTDILTRTALLLPHRDSVMVDAWASFAGVEGLLRLGDRVIVETMRAIVECLGRSSSLREAETRARLLDVSTALRQCYAESGQVANEVGTLWRRVLLRCGDALPGLIERCLTLQPSRSSLAHDAFDAMLACTPPSEIRRFISRLGLSQSGQMPLRFTLAGTFLDVLSDVCPKVGGLATLDARTLLQGLVRAYWTHARSSPEDRRPHLADMIYAVIISQFVASHGSRARRPDLEVEALCQGYRFDEAASIAARQSHLPVGPRRTPIGQFVKEATDATPHQRRTRRDSFEKDYLLLLQQHVGA